MFNIVERVTSLFRFEKSDSQLFLTRQSDKLGDYLPGEKKPADEPVASDKQISAAKKHEQETKVLTVFSSQKINRDFYQNIFKNPLNQQLVPATQRKSLETLLLQLINNTAFRNKVTPRLPAVIPQLLQCIRDETSSTKKLVTFINKDPNVAASVLRASNSILYNPGGRIIDSFERAVVIIGRDGLKSIACTSMMRPISKDKSCKDKDFGEQIWAHSLRTAIAAQLIAASYPVNPFNAYLAGLFHSVGDITLFNQINLRNEDNRLRKTNGFYYLQQKNLDALTAAIVKEWHLADDIVNIFLDQGSKEMHEIQDKALLLSQMIHLLNHEAISELEFYQMADFFAFKRFICEKTIELSADTISPTQH
ncbi:MAG: HDOD domain-containing protein [Pseudomonadales bacterium]|nr:HDOD domain-containing protein [Pseudomonadales bacterium]